MPVHVILLHTAAGVHNRRILHQPFSIPNQPSSSSTSLPFFPDLPSPPPQPPAFSSFPDNISSSKSNSGSSKLVAVSVSLAVSAVVITVIALFLYLRRQRRDGFSNDDSKTSLSDTSSLRYHANVVGVSGNVLLMPRVVSPPNSSSEFLYLGTIVNSRGIHDLHGFQNGGESDTYLRKPDSPELRPLPPLGGQICRKDRVHAELDEEFSSPRGYLGARESSTGAGRAFAAVMVESLTGRNSESSSSYSSSSSSDSQLRSVSLSISPQISWRPKSPELTPMHNAPPPPSLKKPVVRTGSRFSIPLYSDRNPRSQSMSSSSSPDRPEVKIQYSSLSIADPPLYPAPAYPPPPPPPPYPAPLSPNQSSSRPISNFKPKLKPLHWDKVRARSDREMVWDQLKSSFSSMD
ncbi:formin-like protein 1 [Impatiens glandulifera]|uniref:formin-like protein 1 n=1 Tax=Impatiens glandulifera TaxID=253017 RepID=UPI001FB147B6|nr:formin-like protein 1 [Impatiens glandulifera]